MAVNPPEGAVRDHYGREGLAEAVLGALARAGKDVTALTLEDLAPIEEFHIGGRRQTLALGRLAGLAQGERVVDVGCGVGGPARVMAHHFGCDVVGVDLSEAFCQTATLLNERTGLGRKVRIRHGSALDLPLEDGWADAVWMQHVAMNIPDKEALLREIGRVLRPGGRLALHEVFAGPLPEEHFPVPWAGGPDMSFLISPEEARRLLEAAGFRIEAWQDVTDESASRLRGALEKAAGEARPSLGLALLMGPRFPAMAANVRRSLEEDRLRIVRAVGILAPPAG
jgi:SAM-dependent methyltransferase